MGVSQYGCESVWVGAYNGVSQHASVPPNCVCSLQGVRHESMILAMVQLHVERHSFGFISNLQ